MLEALLVMISLLLGGLLGARYKVLVLVPAMLAGWIFMAVIGAILDVSALSSLVAMAVGTGMLQIGYLIGAVVRSRVHVTLPIRTPIPSDRRPAIRLH